MKFVFTLHSEVVVGSDREGSRDDLSDKICNFTPDLCLVLIVCICHVVEFVGDELWSDTGLHQVLHELAQELETFNSSEIHFEGHGCQISHFCRSARMLSCTPPLSAPRRRRARPPRQRECTRHTPGSCRCSWRARRRSEQAWRPCRGRRCGSGLWCVSRSNYRWCVPSNPQHLHFLQHQRSE